MNRIPTAAHCRTCRRPILAPTRNAPSVCPKCTEQARRALELLFAPKVSA